MGGIGSGRFFFSDRKHAVEECTVLSTTALSRSAVLCSRCQLGTVVWDLGNGPILNSSIYYEWNHHGDTGQLELSYSVGIGGEQRQESYTVEMTATRPYFGGKRWWFLCPAIVDGQRCQRRCSKLYLPPDGQVFGCLSCHDLTYKSCRESHTIDNLYKILAVGTEYSPEHVKHFFKTILKNRSMAV